MFECRLTSAINEEGERWFDTAEQAIQQAWHELDTEAAAYAVVEVETGEPARILFQGMEYRPWWSLAGEK